MKLPLDPRKIEMLDEAMVSLLRAKSLVQRLAMGFDCNRTARLVIAGHLRTLRPDWPEEQVQAEVARRMLLGTD
ncbi:MAG TPA: hypothetical protein VIK18_27260 [Pirellulales bacterium]